MILFPAIDLKDGKCVRLRRGEMSEATIFNADPADQARRFAEQGFPWLHVVDLDGAIAGHAMNRTAIESILKAISIPVQLGGGIRNMASIEAWLMVGVARVMLGTVAVKSPDLVSEACRRFPGRIAVAIDARDGRVSTDGWTHTSDVSAMELARRFEGQGVAAIICTDIDRDGILTGINIDSTLRLANSVDIPVIASGGLASLADIKRLLEPDCSTLAGAIAGRALYDGRLDAGEALRLIAEAA